MTMADGNGSNGAMTAADKQALANQMRARRKGPYSVPGQICDDVQGRVGPCDGVFKMFYQCDAPFMTATVWLQWTTAGAGSNLVMAPQTPVAYSQGTGSSAADAGGSTFGALTQADTIVGENNALGMGEGMIFQVSGMAVGFGRAITTTGTNKQYGNPYIRAYYEDMVGAALDDVSILFKHSSQTGDQWLGNLANWRPANFQDKLPDAGRFTALRCRDLSGAQSDSDKLVIKFQNEKTVEVINDPGSPTPAGLTVFLPVKVVLYGDPECRDKSGVCPTPTMDEVDALKSRVGGLENGMARILAKLGA